MVITQLNLYKNICFHKYSHDSGPKVSPDMILNAFYMKFVVLKTMRYLPEPVDP